MLAVVEHRRFVLLALTDHHHAVHADGVQHVAHPVDRRLVSALLLPHPDKRCRRERGRLGHANELER